MGLSIARRRHSLGLVAIAVACATLVCCELMVARDTGVATLLKPVSGAMLLAAVSMGWWGIVVGMAGLIGGYALAVSLGGPSFGELVVAAGITVPIALGFGLQAWVQAALIRSLRKRRVRLGTRLLAGLPIAPLTCLIGSVIGTLTLWLGGAIVYISPCRFWLMWYAGSTLAVLMAFPLAYALNRQKLASRPEREQLGLIATLALLIVATWGSTYFVLRTSIQQQRDEFADRFESVVVAVRGSAQDVQMMSAGMRSGLQAAPISQRGFINGVVELIGHDTTLDSALLARKVDAAGQAGFEQEMSRLNGAPVRVHVLDGVGRAVPMSLARSEVVVERVSAKALSPLLGAVLSTDRTLQPLLAAASRSRHALLSPPLPSLTDTDGEKPVAWVTSMPGDGGDPVYLLLLQKPSLLALRLVEQLEELPEGSFASLEDVTGPEAFDLLDALPRRAEPMRVHVGKPFPSAAFFEEREFGVGGRRWLMRGALPSSSAYPLTREWWLSQAMIQLFGAALGAMVLIAFARRTVMNDMEAQLAALSRRYLAYEALPEVRPLPGAMPSPVKTGGVDVEAELARAWDAGELRPYYEPIIDLVGGRIQGFESLLRWPTSTVNVSVPEIIGWAERTGRIQTLTLNALRDAVERIETWTAHSDGRNLPWISINLSPLDLADFDFIEQVLALIWRHPLVRDQIKIEITEGVLVQDIQNTAQRLRWMRDRGLRIALDDFGTGYSSLSYLHQLPVDSIKIDRSFVASLDSDPRVREIVQATIELGRRLDLEVLAEGVEDAQVVQFLRRAGCHAAQGYKFSRAQPGATIDQWVQSRRRFDLY